MYAFAAGIFPVDSDIEPSPGTVAVMDSSFPVELSTIAVMYEVWAQLLLTVSWFELSGDTIRFSDSFMLTLL